jgi:hypothetical protein
MRHNWILLAGAACVLAFSAIQIGLVPSQAHAAQEQPVRVLVVTGGHDFEKQPFFAVFKNMTGIVFDTAEQKESSEAYDGDLSKYDVLVLYDMPQEITDAQKDNLLRFLGAGKGLVGLHHCLGSYQDWPEFQKIIGGKFYTAEGTKGRPSHTESKAKHDVRFNVKVARENYPVILGLSDFEILDEAYKKYVVRADVKGLLRVDNPLSGTVVAWTHWYGIAPVAYILFGHGRSAFNDPSYQKLVTNAIRWAARRSPVR